MNKIIVLLMALSIIPLAIAFPLSSVIPPQCSDGIDNDRDGFIDIEDGGCSFDIANPSTYNPFDNSETTQCQDRIDNDGNGFIDLKDIGCQNVQDDSEFSGGPA